VPENAYEDGPGGGAAGAAGDASGPSGEPEHHSRLYEAAIEAEYATGVREETEAEAKASVLRRLARITGGFLLLIVGLLAIPLPGPGWLIVAAALVVLSRDFVWAERTLDLVRRRIPGAGGGQIPARTWVLMSVAGIVGIGASVWWTLLR
jgi:uncharacterized protein (TIGR02611 family)